MNIPGYDQWKLQAPGDGLYDRVEESDEWTAEDEECARIEAEWDAKVAADEEAVARRVEAEENERTEREDAYAFE